MTQLICSCVCKRLAMGFVSVHVCSQNVLAKDVYGTYYKHYVL